MRKSQPFLWTLLAVSAVLMALTLTGCVGENSSEIQQAPTPNALDSSPSDTTPLAQDTTTTPTETQLPNDGQATPPKDATTLADAQGPTPDAPGADLTAPTPDQITPPQPDQVTPPLQPSCAKLPPASGTIVVVAPGQAGQLRQIVSNAASGTTILLKDGTYLLNGGDTSSRLSFGTANVTLRSESGNPGAVILDGNYQTNELVTITASNVTIAEITLKRAYDHPIHVSGPGSTISGVTIYRVRIIDPGQQAIKINPDGGGYADNGSIACSYMELTDAGRPQIRDSCYTGGIDAHQSWGWTFRHNLIKGFWCSDGLSEHGIHVWNGARDTIVEGNQIINCARGIGFGLGANGNGNYRTYPDNRYSGVGYIGHYDGVIRNNFIMATIPGFDSGITLDQARGTLVVHNTVVSQNEPFASIEWRFANTQVTLTNNLVSHNLRERDGNPQSTLSGNLEHAPSSYFVDPWAGDLHLTPGALNALGKGQPLAGGICDNDIDGEQRLGARDIGADQR